MNLDQPRRLVLDDRRPQGGEEGRHGAEQGVSLLVVVVVEEEEEEGGKEIQHQGGESAILLLFYRALNEVLPFLSFYSSTSLFVSLHSYS